MNGPRRVLAMARKEWMHIGRDKTTLYFALLMPVLMLMLFGWAVSFDIDGIETAVVDDDHTPESRELVHHLFSGKTFHHAVDLERADAIEPLFRRGDARLGIVVPHGYGADVRSGRPARVQLLVDAADNVTAGTVLSYVTRFGAVENGRLWHDAGLSPVASIETRTRALYNPGLRSVMFLLPGLIALIQAMMSILLTALTVAREWERGSMEQLFATPVRRLEIVLGKLVPYFGVAMAGLLIVLLIGTFVFDVPVRGSIALLFGVSSLFLLAGLGQGLLISVVTRNQMVATQLAAVSSMLPAALLSGLVIPIENMPRALQLLTYLLPARHFVTILRGIFLRDVSATAILPNIVALAAFALVMLAVSTARFRRELG
jgi:ABC-2 type transport system permease protein